MHFPSLLRHCTLLAGITLCAKAADLAGDNIYATGNLDIKGNTASFGSEGIDAGYILNYIPTSDTIEFDATSSAATWLWRQGPISGYQSQMQLSGAGLLSLFRAGGAAGVVLNPASASGATNEFIQLNSSTTADGTSQRIAGYSDVRNGYLDFKRFTAAGPVTGLVLGTYGGDVVTIRSTGASDSGNVGIGTSTPSAKLEVSGSLKVSGTGSTIIAPSLTLPDGSTLTTARTNTLYNSSGMAVATVDASGKVNFTNGLSVGSGASPAVITPNSAAYLNQTLANLGFRENPVAATAVSSISIRGDVAIRGITQDANYVYIVGEAWGPSHFGTYDVPASDYVSSGSYAGSYSFIAKFDQAGTAQWVSTVAINGPSISFNAVAVDGSGNVVAAGEFSGTTMTLVSPATNITSNGGSYDAVVVKCNAAGQIQWAKRVGGPEWDSFYAVAVDGSGNVAVAGEFVGTTTGLSSPATNLTSNVGGYDAFVVKYNVAGQSQWAQRVGGPDEDRFNAVAMDGSGNVFAAGAFYGTTTGLSSPATNLVSNQNSRDGLVVKYSASGQSQWAQRVGGPDEDYFNAVAVDGSGNVFAAGAFYGTTTGLSSPATALASTGGDAILVKYNSTGLSQWAQNVGCSASFDSVAIDGSGNLVVSGAFSGTTTNLISPATNVTSTGTNRNGLIVSYSANGHSQNASTCGFMLRFKTSVQGTSYWAGGFTWEKIASVGMARVSGTFLVGWNGLPLTAPDTGSAAPLAWGGSEAQSNGVALGSSAYASGNGSAALGTGTANAANAFASGSSIANAEGAVALGLGSQAYGLGSTAIGNGAFASGDSSTALGASGAWAVNATALGASFADGVGAVAAGNWNYAHGSYSVAMGTNSTANGYGSTAIGVNVNAQAYASTAVGQLNIAQGNSTTWVPTDDLFVVGNGDTSTWTPSNAFVVKKNGDAVVSGNLTVSGQPVATANQLSAYQLANGSGANLTGLNAAQLTSGTLPLSVLPASVVQLSSNQTLTNKTLSGAVLSGNTVIGGANTAVQMAISNNGNVGIGTSASSDKLLINGNTRIDGTMAIRAATIPYIQLRVGQAGVSDILQNSMPLYGLYAQPVNTGNGGSIGVYSDPIVHNYATGGTSPSITGYASHLWIADGPVTKGIHFEAQAPYIQSGSANPASLTNVYGVYINPQKITGVTNAYGIYQLGANDLNYFSGNVGIGTSTPAAKLDVVGNATISGTLTIGGAPVLTTNGSGANLTNIPASAITASGTRSSTSFLRGDNTWAEPPSGSGVGTGVTDSDKGDITVSANGTVWTVDSGLPLSRLATNPLDRANHTGTQAWSTISDTPTTAAGYGISDVVTKGTGGAVTLPGATTAAGDITVKNRAVIRVSRAGDIDMGSFQSGTNPEL